jgi:hypothetical protein
MPRTSDGSTARRLLAAGVTAVTLTTALPGAAVAAHAQPLSSSAMAFAATEYEDRLAVAVKFGFGDRADLVERIDRDFVTGLWTLLKDKPEHSEVRVAAELAFTAAPADIDQASADFILTGVYAAHDRDIERERRTAEAKRQSDLARTAAAASVDIIADATLLNGTDDSFIRQIRERLADDPGWREVVEAARAVHEGTAEQQRQFIASGIAAAAKAAVERRIAEDEEKSQAEKEAALARAAKQLAANRIGLPVTKELLELPNQDFVVAVWNHAADGSQVQTAAIAAVRSSDPAAWKAFIETGVHEARNRDIRDAAEKVYQADRVEAERLRTEATGNGYLNLLHAVNKAVNGTPDDLRAFVSAGQYQLGLTTGFESGDVQPTWSDSPVTPNGVVNVSKTALGVRSEPGHTGTAGLVYSGTDDNTLQSFAYLRSMALSRVTVKPTTTLSYWIQPQSSTARPEVKTRNSTCVAVDLTFSDGTNLRDSGLTDQRGNRVHPAYQCSKLTADRWNRVVVKLGDAFIGKQVTSLSVGYEQAGSIGAYRGLIDDVTITDQPIGNPGDDNGPAPVYPADEPVRDFNSDGFADVFVRNGEGQLRLYRGNGKGGWLNGSTGSDLIGTGWNSFTAVFSPGDFNGDGLVDVITRNTAGELRLYRGNGRNGWIDPSSSLQIGTGWNQFTAIFSPGDFNGDGFADVIVRNAEGELRLYRGNGKGGWLNGSTGSDLIGTGWARFTSLFSPGDFNGDGFSDVIVRNAQGELLLYRGNGRGGWVDGSTNIKIGTGWNQFNVIF